MQVKSNFQSVVVVNGTKNSTQPGHSIRTSGMEFNVTSFHLGKLSVVCIANVYNVFSVKNEIILDEEKPKLAPSIFNSYGTSTGKLLLKFHVPATA